MAKSVRFSDGTLIMPVTNNDVETILSTILTDPFFKEV